MADRTSAGLLAERELKRKRRQEIDDDNEKQVWGVDNSVPSPLVGGGAC